MIVFVRKIYIILFLPLLLGCNSSKDFIITDTPLPVEVPSPSSTPANIVVIYDELPKINILSGTNLIASPAFPKSQLANAIVKPDESVYLVGSDKDNAWLLVLYMNTLGWIPSIFSITGTGALEPTVVETPPLDNCAIYLGSVITPNGRWESSINTRVLVQGLIYSQIEQENSEVIALAFQIEETGQEYSAQINRITLESGNAVLLFTALIDNIQLGNHVKYNLSGLRQEITPFQAAFFIDDCSNPFTNLQTIQPPQLEQTPISPISTLIIRITSSVMPPPTIVPPTFVPRDCPGAPPIRVKINDLARVTYTTGEILRLRSSPEIKNSNIKARLSEGTQIKIFDGPVCSNGFAFWWVRVKSTNTFGWVAEGDSSDYYIEMINRP